MPQKSTISTSDAFSDYLRVKHAQGTKNKTLKSYEQHFRAIGHHLDTSLNISELDKKKYEQMISSMIASGLSPNSIKSYTVTLRAFLNWCNTVKKVRMHLRCAGGSEEGASIAFIYKRHFSGVPDTLQDRHNKKTPGYGPGRSGICRSCRTVV